jgi:hypothetical protein
MTRLSWFSGAAVRPSLWRARGALVALTFLVESACLVPQSIDAIDADAGPHAVPHIVLETIPTYLLAPVLTLYRQGPADAVATPACSCKLVLNVPQVADEDPSITLLARWFVDYNLAVPSSTLPWKPQTIEGNFDTGTTVRTLLPYDFDADTHNIVTNGLHIVELVVGERDGFDDTSLTLPNRAMKPGYEAAVYRFAIQVNVTQDPNQPHCPNQPPSVPVCN